jgi:hypothetical protein
MRVRRRPTVQRSRGWHSKSGNAKAGKLAGTWSIGFRPSGNCLAGETWQAPFDRGRGQWSRSHRSERGSRSGCPTQPQNRFIPSEAMNARTIETPPGLPERGDGSSAMKLLSPRSRQARHLRAIAAEATLYGWDDAVESREELIRNVEGVGRMPWHQRGLKE